MIMSIYSRRTFIKTSVLGGVASTFIKPFDTFATVSKQESPGAKVSLTTGDNRADMAFRALQPFSKEIKHAIGNRMVVAMGPPSVFSRNSQFHLLLRLFLYLA